MPSTLKQSPGGVDSEGMSRILIADDDPEIRSSLDKLLCFIGHEVKTVEDGLEAIRELGRASYDVLIADIVMPRQDGLGCLMEAHKEYPELIMIAISGGGKKRNASYLKMARSFGAVATFDKPFAPRELIAKLDELVGRVPQPG